MSETQRKKNRQTPWDGPGQQEPTGFGVWLRRERELREISLEEIAETTKISKSYLEALEDERFDVLPAPLFAKGFLREYARYVGLDPDEVVNSYLTARDDGEDPVGADSPSAERKSSFEWTSGALLAAGLVLLLVVVGFLGFWTERSQNDAAPEPSDPTVEAASTADLDSGGGTDLADEAGPAAVETANDLPAAPASRPTELGQEPAAPPVTAAPLVVTIDFTEDCWVEATVDGRRRLSELHVQGESLQIDAERLVSLTLGNPGGVRIEVNGDPWDLGAFPVGRVARDIRIALDDIRGGEEGE